MPDFVSKPVLPKAVVEPKKETKAETSTSKDKDKDDITMIREKHAQEQASEEWVFASSYRSYMTMVAGNLVKTR